MSTRGTADIVFCLDSSASMRPCFDGVRNHIGEFTAGLGPGAQTRWDLRFDFVAYSCSEEPVAFLPFRSVHSDDLWTDLYAGASGQGRFFTKDVARFRAALARLTAQGNEASLVGLDFALDFPWREAATCHRAVVLMTDEPFESGVLQERQRAALDQLIDKIQTLRVLLFLVAPQSDLYSTLSEADRCEYIVVDGGDGLARVDFREVLSHIGKSVSVSYAQQGPRRPARRVLFGQPAWLRGAGGSLSD